MGLIVDRNSKTINLKQFLETQQKVFYYQYSLQTNENDSYENRNMNQESSICFHKKEIQRNMNELKYNSYKQTIILTEDKGINRDSILFDNMLMKMKQMNAVQTVEDRKRWFLLCLKTIQTRQIQNQLLANSKKQWVQINKLEDNNYTIQIMKQIFQILEKDSSDVEFNIRMMEYVSDINYNYQLTDKVVQKVFNDLIENKNSMLDQKNVESGLLEVMLEFVKRQIKRQYVDRENIVDTSEIFKITQLI